ncbi:MAG: hypothetical protein WC657_01820 [Candidatus Paceibacterota bacterium]|jgi:hypothetical protein
MSLESPNNKKTITEAEWGQLKQDSQYYVDLIRSKSEGASRSCTHILNNLGLAISYILYDLNQKSPLKDPELYQNAIDAISDIKKYLKLLEEFPDFAEKELGPGYGCFPEISTKVAKIKEMIGAYEKKLRKI